MTRPQRDQALLDNIDPGKRKFIGRLIGTGAFVAPVVASFSMANIVNAEAAPLNGSVS